MATPEGLWFRNLGIPGSDQDTWYGVPRTAKDRNSRTVLSTYGTVVDEFHPDRQLQLLGSAAKVEALPGTYLEGHPVTEFEFTTSVGDSAPDLAQQLPERQREELGRIPMSVRLSFDPQGHVHERKIKIDADVPGGGHLRQEQVIDYFDWNQSVDVAIPAGDKVAPLAGLSAAAT